jgi:S-formylglutathione hydrolase FrmB
MNLRLALRRSFLASMAVIVALLVMALPAQAATFGDGNGISVVSQSTNGREIDLQVATTDVQGQHQVIVLLPEGYSTNQTTRYPVLYLLHGALAGPSGWVSPPGAAPQITDPYPVITVIPDGGLKGWYTDWVNGYQYAPQNWEDFHLSQLVPWIDANLRTIADRSGRAVAGLSMGGFGSIHYAEDRPDLFSYAASFSGALDLGNQYTESAIYGEETGMVPGAGPSVPPGAIFGPEYWPSNQHEVDLSDVNPANVAHLRNTTVALYVGTGDGQTNLGGAFIEGAVKPQNDQMASQMAQAGVNYWYSQDHQPSPAFGWGCDNNHDQQCWNAYLADDMPRLMAVLQHP